MKLLGYVDRWSGAAGDTLTFHVSCELPRYRAELVRLSHGERSRSIFGFKEELIQSTLEGEYEGGLRPILAGSCVRVDDVPCLRSLTFAAWVWPTLLNGREQYIFSRYDWQAKKGCALWLTPEGQIAFRVCGNNTPATLILSGPVVTRRWVFIAAVIGSDGTIRLHRRLADYSPAEPPQADATIHLDGAFADAAGRPVLLGSGDLEVTTHGHRLHGPFNGKLSAPMLFAHALTVAEVNSFAAGEVAAIAPRALARWNFAARAGMKHVPDESGHDLHGLTVNGPGRLVTGHNFSGRTSNPHQAPEEFNAVHLHEDDLTDAGWEPSFRFTIPQTLRSAVYAAKISSGEHSDYIPFVVRAQPGKTGAPVAFLLPTVSYMAYANSSLDPSVLPTGFTPLSNPSCCQAERAYVARHRLLSLYDHHSDGSGVTMSTMLRPMPIYVRPDSQTPWNGSAHQFGADLHTIGWLDARGIPYDVLTDHDIDREGVDALSRYRVVVSGTHAEYWTGKMLDALAAYQQKGGRFIYLSGNGLYWVTALSEDQTLVEIRRARGTRSWTAAPGEEYLSLTGEQGGLWRDRDRAPQRYVGVGFAAQGFDRGCGYRRLPASYEPRARFIFEGVMDDVVGDFPALVSAYGAAGFEVDRADRTLGTPDHALILASASSFSDCYQAAIEEVGGTTPFYGGTTYPTVRADMVFYETPNHGAVFSVGSIAWSSALSYNHCDNNVSRITENVIRAFSSSGPLPRE